MSLLQGVDYDEMRDEAFKTYKEEVLTLPFNLCMRKRHQSHFHNIEERCNTVHGRISVKQPAICFNQQLLGVVGVVKSIDHKNQTVKLIINKEDEESKIHNPFLAENFLRRELQNEGHIDQRGQVTQKKKQQARQFYGDQEIEHMLDLEPGTVNKLTGSYLIAYDTPDQDQRQVVDIGLNMKNFTKKVHIADYVRFIQVDNASASILDDFNHDRLARGAKHIRKHWEYSGECIQIIKDYLEKFPEAFEAIEYSAGQKKDKAMHSLWDLYPDIPKNEKDKAISKLKEMLAWIEGLPLSKLPYVEMGFDALDTDLVNRLQSHHEHVKDFYQAIDLKVHQVETIAISNIYQECFPFWFGPFFEKNTVKDFRVGNRVINLNSTLRKFIPFGARGTVVGKTEDKLIVMFDDQFIHGNTIYGHCQNYRGAQVDPNNLLNLSREFARMVKDNYRAASKFMEKPIDGFPAFADEMNDQKRAEEAPRNSLRARQLQVKH